MDNELALKLWVVLSRAHAAVREHAVADQEQHGLSEGEFAVMEALYHKGPMLLVEVQRKVLVSSGGITYLVDRLARKGYVERKPCASDRRASYAVLTPEGERVIAGIFPAHAEAIAHAMAGLTEAEARQAVKLIRKLGLAADAASPLGGSGRQPAGSSRPPAGRSRRQAEPAGTGAAES